jgi:hypothetical protein
MKSLLAITLLLTAGCFAPMRYAYVSPAGQACYFDCKHAYAECNSTCLDWLCGISCSDSEISCFNICPDLLKVPNQ